jgi:hypothetical protein
MKIPPIENIIMRDKETLKLKLYAVKIREKRQKAFLQKNGEINKATAKTTEKKTVKTQETAPNLGYSFSKGKGIDLHDIIYYVEDLPILGANDASLGSSIRMTR